MKKILLVALMSMFLSVSYAQLSDYSIAPDFTMYQINKTTGALITDSAIHLYDYLDAGKPTVIDFFAYWCGPCWSYHTSGHLDNFYETYGPSGTNEMRALMIAADGDTYAQLSGQTSGYPNNWLTGNIPIIPTGISPNTETVSTNYAIHYFPTVYLVCPSRFLIETKQQTTASLYAKATTLCPDYTPNLQKNALILKFSNVSPVYQCNATILPRILIQNVGTERITTAVFNITIGTTIDTSYTWNGSLAPYATTTVSLPSFGNLPEGTNNLTVTIETVNGVTDSDLAGNTISYSFSYQLQSVPFQTQDFSGTFPPTLSGSLNGIWYKGTSIDAICFPAYSVQDGVTDDWILPTCDITAVSAMADPVLRFDVAHARYSSSYSERLAVMVAANCGSSFSTVYQKYGASLATTSNTNSAFTPTSASQWRTEEVSLANYISTDLNIKFRATSAYGNNIWLDNIQIVDGLSIDSHETSNHFEIYPNPAQNTVTVTTQCEVENAEIFNLQGKLIQSGINVNRSIDVSQLSSGVYFMRFTTEDGIFIKRFVKE